MSKYKEYFKVTDEAVFGFFEGYRYLSNFHICPVYYETLLYPNSENAYQAAKNSDIEIRKKFLTISPKEGRALGQQIACREDWDKVKYDIMLSIVFNKFYQNKDIRKLLIETDELYLEETNHWGDKYWGVNHETKEGENRLGEILMAVRCIFQYCPSKLLTPALFHKNH